MHCERTCNVLCGSFYAPYIKFHSFSHLFISVYMLVHVHVIIIQNTSWGSKVSNSHATNPFTTPSLNLTPKLEFHSPSCHQLNRNPRQKAFSLRIHYGKSCGECTQEIMPARSHFCTETIFLPATE